MGAWAPLTPPPPSSAHPAKINIVPSMNAQVTVDRDITGKNKTKKIIYGFL